MALSRFREMNNVVAAVICMLRVATFAGIDCGLLLNGLPVFISVGSYCIRVP